MVYLITNQESGEVSSGTYQGQWKRDLREGQGRMQWDDGTSFEGTWKAGQRARGLMVMSDGLVYEGPFESDQFHGRGRISMRVSEGVTKTFEGFFTNGQIPLRGKLTMTGSKEVYLGEVDQGFERKGYGYLFSEEGRYEGHFKEDGREGHGLQLFKAGGYYIGQWMQDHYEGRGRLVSATQTYEGEFEKGLKNGEGTLLDHKAGTVITATWKQGKLNGDVTLALASNEHRDWPASSKSLREAFKLPPDLK
jgi:hypothetical protein